MVSSAFEALSFPRMSVSASEPVLREPAIDSKEQNLQKFHRAAEGGS